MQCWDTPNCGGHVAITFCGLLLILFPALNIWRPHRRRMLCSQFTQLGATTDFVFPSQTLGTSHTAAVYVVTRLICGSTDFDACSQALGPPAKQGLCRHHAQSLATAAFVPRFEMLGNSLTCSSHVRTKPSPVTIDFLSQVF